MLLENRFEKSFVCGFFASVSYFTRARSVRLYANRSKGRYREDAG
jgi:hypothetical protein